VSKPFVERGAYSRQERVAYISHQTRNLEIPATAFFFAPSCAPQSSASGLSTGRWNDALRAAPSQPVGTEMLIRDLLNVGKTMDEIRAMFPWFFARLWGKFYSLIFHQTQKHNTVFNDHIPHQAGIFPLSE
jgi:hypothetical protein